MPAVTAAPVARLGVLAAVSLVLVGGAAATGSSAPAPPVPAFRPASLAPHGAAGRLGPARASRAAQACAEYAAAAGWANNGQYGGDLVIAVAVCVAESGGQPSVYYCDGTGSIGFYPPVNCPPGSYDRGLWQINSKYHPEVTDTCAFHAQCNADAAYQISDQGTDFAPWAVYDTDAYARYLGAAQQAVSGLAAGRCGRRTGAQRWTVSGGTVRQGTLCLDAGTGAGRPGDEGPVTKSRGPLGHRGIPGGPAPQVSTVIVSTCGGGPSQTWAPYGSGELRNEGTGECLRDPRGSRAGERALRLAGCTTTRAKTWWLP